MDAPVRQIEIAEHAEHAARLAADTFEHQPNPHQAGTDDHRQWEAAYARYFEAFTTGEASA
jgi:hypothetical protein